MPGCIQGGVVSDNQGAGQREITVAGKGDLSASVECRPQIRFSAIRHDAARLTERDARQRQAQANRNLSEARIKGRMGMESSFRRAGCFHGRKLRLGAPPCMDAARGKANWFSLGLIVAPCCRMVRRVSSGGPCRLLRDYGPVRGIGVWQRLWGESALPLRRRPDCRVGFFRQTINPD